MDRIREKAVTAMPLGARSPGSHWRARVGFVVGAIAIALAALAPAAGAAASPPWTEAPYSYYAENVPLTTALRDFASSFSLALELTPSINGKVNGQFNAKSPTEFIDRLAGVYSLNWFVHAGTLYVSRTKEAVTRRISSGGSSITSVRQALESVGVLDPRFGWGELPGQGVALVSGPPAYVDLIERTLALQPASARDPVFRCGNEYINSAQVARERGCKLMDADNISVLRSESAAPAAASPGAVAPSGARKPENGK